MGEVPRSRLDWIAKPLSRPPEGRARRVLTSSTSSSTNNIRSPTLASSKPIRARVDLSSLASPPTSPSLNSSTTSSWTPNQPKVKAKSSVGFRSAPTTPTVQSPGVFKATPTNGYFRAALSPQTPATPVTSGGGTRAISPKQRARSPDVADARTRTTSRVNATSNQASLPGDLRGQRDPFPTSSASSNNSTSVPAPITHLPSSVSVRKLHSPSLRASQRRDTEQHYLSASTSTNASSSSSSALPPLSTSPSSIASSPLTSPNLNSSYDPSPANHSPRLPHSTTSTGLGFYDQTASIGRKSGSSSNSSVRRSSGISSLSSSSMDSNTNTPTGNKIGGGTGNGLLPAFPSYSSASPSLSQSSYITSPPLPSPTSFSNVSPNPSNPLLRSPTFPSSASTKTLRSVPTTTTVNSTPFERPPIRTRTITGSSSGSIGGSGSIPFPSSGTVSTTSATLDSPHGNYGRARVDQVEWDQNERWHGGGGGGETPTSPKFLSTSPTTGSGMVNGMESLMRESIEKEIEAKVSRRIMDLEIRTSSLLSINAQLERQKLKQTSEIRELRRKLRESIGGVGIRRFDVDEGRSSSGGEFSDLDELDEEDEEDEDGRVQPSWEELLRADQSFGQVATLVEGLIKRGKKAIEYKVEEKWEKGRVLSTVEMEDRLEERAEEEEEEDVQSGSEGSVE